MKTSWQTKPFESCLEKITYTTKIQRKDFLESGDFPIVSQEVWDINGYWNNKSDVFEINKPVIIFWDHTKIIKYIDFDFVLGADWVKILQSKDFLDTRYFCYFLQSVELKSLWYARHYRLLRELNVPIPPLSTQLDIVARLDSAMAEIDSLRTETESALTSTRELWESTLESVFASGGKDWEEKRLWELATFRNGMNFTKGSKGEEIKIVGVRDFKNRFLVPFESLESVVIDGKLSETDFLKENDILAVRSNGNPELIWRTLLSWKVAEKTSHSWFTIRIRLNEWILSSVYLCHFLKTQKSRKELISSGTGINIKSLNQWALSALEIPFPPLSEQSHIVAHLDAVRAETEQLEILYNAKLASLDELRRSVLAEAFS